MVAVAMLMMEEMVALSYLLQLDAFLGAQPAQKLVWV